MRGIAKGLWVAQGLFIEEDGASASEYAVLTALVVVAVAAAVSAFELNVFFGIKEKVLACVSGANGC